MAKKKLELLDSDEEREDKLVKKANFEFKINKQYAERYENWRSKEELQKLKDKYGDVSNLESSSSSDETEDEDAKELTKDVELEFFKALSMVKSHDQKIYDKEHCRFFDSVQKQQENASVENEASDKSKKKKDEQKKSFYLKDLEREMILKKMEKTDGLDDSQADIFEDEHVDSLKANKSTESGYYEEQAAIKKSLKEAIKNSKVESEESEDENFLKIKAKTKEEKEKEEADYIEWLKGKKNKITDPEIENSMKYLHDYWNDPKISEGERFLRDYILNKRYLEKSEDEEQTDDEDARSQLNAKVNSSKVESDKPDQQLDYVDFSEEEKIIENQEQFERKYNFRYEEPDPEFIKSYPRTIDGSMRRKDTKRKEKRDEYKKRKELEKQKKKEEIKRLKSLKRKEIMDKLEKIKKITGNLDLKLDIDDLDKDFDPEEYEKKMQKIFNDEFYQQDDPELEQRVDEDGKPIFTDDDDDDLKINENWDMWSNSTNKPTVESQYEIEKVAEEDSDNKKNKKKKKKKKKNNEDEDELEDPEFNMDADYDQENAGSRGKKKNKLSEALMKEKPVFDPNEKSFEEYYEEYYKLDCEDVIGGDLPCRFKYREVVPNDYGLDVEEILACKDTELNQWASLRKAIAYRPIQEEIQEAKTYKNKKNNIDLKKKILASYYNLSESENEAEKIDEEKEQEQMEDLAENSAEKQAEEQQRLSKTDNEKKEKTERVYKKDSNLEKLKHNNNKKKNKNVLESITDERLAAFGINPKKFKKKIKYTTNRSNNKQK